MPEILNDSLKLRCTMELRDRLEALRDGRPLAEIVREACQQWADAKEKEGKNPHAEPQKAH